MRSAKRTPQRPSPRDTSFGPALATVESLRERLFAVVPSAAIVTLATREAVGAVVVSDLVVPRDEPATAISLLCGHAVASLETIGASPYAPVDLVTGHRVEPGTPIEPPCDAVLAADAIIAIAGGRQVQESVAPGENLLRAGASATAGTRIATAGTRFSPAAALFAEACGSEAVAVRRVRVGVLHDGSPTGAVAARTLATLVGTGPATIDVATFSAEDQGDADLVLLIGRGDLAARDPALDHLRAHGRVDGGGLALTGCEAVAWGEIGGRPALVVPARLEELLIAALTLIAPPIRRSAGERATITTATGRLTRKIVSRIGFTELAFFARTGRGDLEPLAVGRPAWRVLTEADAWLELGPRCEGHAEGSTITATAMPWAPTASDGA